MKEDSELTNYPRDGAVFEHKINLKILNDTIKFSLPIVAIYLVLSLVSVGLILFDHNPENPSPSRFQLGLGLGLTKLAMLGVIGFLVIHWFAEAYDSICGLRRYQRRFTSKQIRSFCFLPILGFLPNAYLAEWLYARSLSHDAPTMTWKSLWSKHSLPNYFGFSVVFYDVCEIARWVSFVRENPALTLLVEIGSEIGLCAALVTGFVLGKATTIRIIELGNQTSLRN